MGLGTMMFGTKVNPYMSFKLMDLYAEVGGMFLDTANMYAHFHSEQARGGESETVIGEWMKTRKNRDRMFVATKVGVPYPGAQRGLNRHQISLGVRRKVTGCRVGGGPHRRFPCTSAGYALSGR
ncbi:MAG: aldo/keto reductase [Kiritimatiellae bacterium]|nr:aldo/keto reductase [Kiritimatiellia bacterium]